jgi:ketosteroid isomerase-like protein
MTREACVQLVASFYLALAKLDTDLFWSVQATDVIYNISGHSPISGRIQGRDAIVADILPAVFGGLDLATFRFATRWKIICQDDHRIVCVMEADGHGRNGVRYDQRYVHVFGFRDGLISELWEFFDTALADAVLFTPQAAVPRSAHLQPFAL